MKFWFRIVALLAVVGVALAFTLERPPVESIQRGYRGVGIEQNYNLRKTLSPEQEALNKVPAPQDPVELAGTPSSEAYQNVKVLKNLDAAEFLRLMAAMTEWVAPDNGTPGQGCAYCHNVENMADDSKYTHKVARRMLQMTQHINADWKSHVANTGVTCYTCHRGHPVPQNIWFAPAQELHEAGLSNTRAGLGMPAMPVGYSSLPSDPFSPFLEGENEIRVNGTTALPSGNRQSIKQAEWTYGLMMHMSNSLGVNCTYCHNSRAFSSWEQSTPQRVNAWYGIRMVRDVNRNYINPLLPVFADVPNRHGPTGDIAKANCTTCHQGAYKPLYGVSMLKDYQAALAGPTDATLQPVALVVPAPPPANPEALPAAIKDKVENAFVFRVDGKDAQNRSAAFDFIILASEYTWVRGSTDQIANQGQAVPTDESAVRVITPQIRSSFEQATDLIGVGLASAEGDRTEEEERANRRSQTVSGWMTTLGEKKQIWRLNLGQYNKTCQKQEDADTSFQRPVILVGVRSKDEGANLQEALAAAISDKSNLPSRQCYSRFDLSKVAG